MRSIVLGILGASALAAGSAAAETRCDELASLAEVTMEIRVGGYATEDALLAEAEGSAVSQMIVELAFSLPREASVEQFAEDIRTICESAE